MYQNAPGSNLHLSKGRHTSLRLRRQKSRNNCERQAKLVALKGQPSQVRYGSGFGIYYEMIAPIKGCFHASLLETRYGYFDLLARTRPDDGPSPDVE
jgi:hypothetical protein